MKYEIESVAIVHKCGAHEIRGRWDAKTKESWWHHSGGIYGPHPLQRMEFCPYCGHRLAGTLSLTDEATAAIEELAGVTP